MFTLQKKDNHTAWSTKYRLILAFCVAFAALGLTFSVLIQRSVAQPRELAQPQAEPAAATIGDPETRIQCTAGYTAYLFAENLKSPHGLAFDPAGNLYVAETSAGQVSRVNANGSVTPVMTGLNSPEGIAFDAAGNMYVVEDVDDGRVMKKAAGSGGTGGSQLAGGLDAPESVIWVDDGSANGILYVTESNLEKAVAEEDNDINEYRTHVTEVSLSGTSKRLVTTTAEIKLMFPVNATFWSYTGLATGPSNILYIANELSGKQISGEYNNIPYTASSTESIFTTNPTAANPSVTAFADGLIAPEGLTFSTNGSFPLYVTEEDISDDDSGTGRLSQVDAAGNRTDLCTGFSTVDDVVIDDNGWLYVSEDLNGTVIQIRSETGSAPDNEFVWLPIILR